MRPINFAFTIIISTAIWWSGCAPLARSPAHPETLNDLHSRLNPTRVADVVYPESVADVVAIVKHARQTGQHISISGGRHAMGGQQFGQDTIHISTRRFEDVVAFDRDKGIVRVESGIQWPALIDYLLTEQRGSTPQWGIIQKQTGADNLSLGDALSANIHGRGGTLGPIVNDVESFTLVTSAGETIVVSRTENAELFSLVIGGYGLFGVIATIDLRLQPRMKLRRVVELIPIAELQAKARQRLADGYRYGDFQFKTDRAAVDFLDVGVFSTYQPVPLDTPIPKYHKVN